MVPDFKKADIEGLKRYLRVTDRQRAGKKAQPRLRTDEGDMVVRGGRG